MLSRQEREQEGWRWTAAVSAVCLSFGVDMASLGMSMSMLLALDTCAKTFNWIAIVGVVFFFVSVFVSWARYSPDGCRVTLPCFLGRLMMAAVFAVPLAVFAHGLAGFDTFRSECDGDSSVLEPDSPAAHYWSTLRSMLTTLVVLHAAKYISLVAVECTAPEATGWCCLCPDHSAEERRTLGRASKGADPNISHAHAHRTQSQSSERKEVRQVNLDPPPPPPPPPPSFSAPAPATVVDPLTGGAQIGPGDPSTTLLVYPVQTTIATRQTSTPVMLIYPQQTNI
jgi:hypothetical protein